MHLSRVIQSKMFIQNVDLELHSSLCFIASFPLFDSKELFPLFLAKHFLCKLVQYVLEGSLCFLHDLTLEFSAILNCLPHLSCSVY